MKRYDHICNRPELTPEARRKAAEAEAAEEALVAAGEARMAAAIQADSDRYHDAEAEAARLRRESASPDPWGLDGGLLVAKPEGTP